MVSPKDRRKTVYQIRSQRPRWVLHMQATFWRVLMGIGMLLHRLAPPRPPKPNFSRNIPATISGKAGEIPLYFYTPKDYGTQKQLWLDRPKAVDDGGEGGNAGKRQSSFSGMAQGMRRRRSSAARRWGGYPVVINFHGGGFTLGTALDDARWCGTVVTECHAVVVSVDYRLAPENPFPTAVEDGVDAVLWVHQHADELGIDTDKIALSGFSSGANMTFSVPLRLYDELNDFPRDDSTTETNPIYRTTTPQGLADFGFSNENSSKLSDSDSSSATAVPPSQTQSNVQIHPKQPAPSLPSSTPTKTATTTTQTALRNINIACLVSWYPSLDYTRTREERRATCARTDHELPALFTDLFDDSYLHPPHSIALDSPYLSPGVAPAALLRNALPEEIILHTCEFDMLLDEGQAFKERLESKVLGPKKVWYRMIEGVPHGWDKAPNPLKPTPGVREHYLRACKELRRVFGPTPGIVERRTAMEGVSTAAPRGSVQVVR